MSECGNDEMWLNTVPSLDNPDLNASLLFPLSGLLVAYCHRFDILTQSSRIYFVACTIGTYAGRGESRWTGLTLQCEIGKKYYRIWFVMDMDILQDLPKEKNQ